MEKYRNTSIKDLPPTLRRLKASSGKMTQEFLDALNKAMLEEPSLEELAMSPLREAATKYQARFGHPVPLPEFKNLSPGEGSWDAFFTKMNQALKSGQPVPEWKNYQPNPLVFPNESENQTPSESPENQQPQQKPLLKQ